MKSTLAVLISCVLSILSQSVRAELLDTPVDVLTDGKRVTQVKCRERDQKKICQKFQFQEIRKSDGSIAFESEVFPRATVEQSIEMALKAYKVLPAKRVLIMGIEVSTMGCKGGSFCAMMLLGIAVDVAKAPVLLSVFTIQGPIRGIKKALLVKRLKKIMLQEKKAKATRMTADTYRKVMSPLF